MPYASYLICSSEVEMALSTTDHKQSWLQFRGIACAHHYPLEWLNHGWVGQEKTEASSDDYKVSSLAALTCNGMYMLVQAKSIYMKLHPQPT